MPEPRRPLDDGQKWSWDDEPGDLGAIVLTRLPESVYRAQQRYVARRRLDELAEP
jgi:hypothetical protein